MNINKLKKEKNAVILAHYYVDGEVQKIADYVGDSFYLARKATEIKADKVIMAGVYFMGESVKILNPDKKVYMVDLEADCPMAHMISVKEIEEMRKKYDDLAVVCYINSTAEIKAHSDLCCTSSNAVKIVGKLKEKNIFFIPDKNLGGNIAKALPEKNIILNQGYCPVHNNIDAQKVRNMKKSYPNAKVLAHPECRSEVVEIADYVGSTSGIIGEIEKNPKAQYIVVTEEGIGSEIKNRCPDAEIHFPEAMICRDMKLITPEKVEELLEKEINEIQVDEKITEAAKIPLKRMLELGSAK
ncbi:quinolinate synthase NadA [Peptoniphilus catoniae]|uniref:quinolinate synthase NadA n=1 Tax=Peptoniphilus catoniae TaxID=1660341 RepID=UPI001FE39C12|nr:quinolinate synthase NadA [Peptoniphilus catoniae]